MENRKLNTIEAAQYLRLKPATLEIWRCLGKGPAYLRLGRRVLYEVADLEAYATVRKIHTRDSVR